MNLTESPSIWPSTRVDQASSNSTPEIDVSNSIRFGSCPSWITRPGVTRSSTVISKLPNPRRLGARARRSLGCNAGKIDGCGISGVPVSRNRKRPDDQVLKFARVSTRQTLANPCSEASGNALSRIKKNTSTCSWGLIWLRDSASAASASSKLLKMRTVFSIPAILPLGALQFFCNSPIVLPSGSANQAKVPVGILTGGTSIFPPNAAALSRYDCTSSTCT